jgi:hypothetical protein
LQHSIKLRDQAEAVEGGDGPGGEVGGGEPREVFVEGEELVVGAGGDGGARTGDGSGFGDGEGGDGGAYCYCDGLKGGLVVQLGVDDLEGF